MEDLNKALETSLKLYEMVEAIYSYPVEVIKRESIETIEALQNLKSQWEDDGYEGVSVVDNILNTIQDTIILVEEAFNESREQRAQERIKRYEELCVYYHNMQYHSTTAYLRYKLNDYLTAIDDVINDELTLRVSIHRLVNFERKTHGQK